MTEVRGIFSKLLGAKCSFSCIHIWYYFRYLRDFYPNWASSPPLPRGKGWIPCFVTRQFSSTGNKCKDQDQWIGAFFGGSSRVTLWPRYLSPRSTSDKAGDRCCSRHEFWEEIFPRFTVSWNCPHSLQPVQPRWGKPTEFNGPLMAYPSLFRLYTDDLFTLRMFFHFPHTSKHVQCGHCLGSTLRCFYCNNQ